MLRIVKAVVILAAVIGVYQVAAIANGTGMPPPSSSTPAAAPARAMTPEEMAVEAYNSGLEHRDKGLKAEEKATAAKKDSDKVKEEKKAREEYEKAFKDFKKAADLNPKLPQALNGMGFAYRKLGDYPKALEMYDKTLEMAPNFPDAHRVPRRGVSRAQSARRCEAGVFDTVCDGSQAGGHVDEGDEGLYRQEEDGSVRRRSGGAVDLRELGAGTRWIGRADASDGAERSPRFLALSRIES